MIPTAHYRALLLASLLWLLPAPALGQMATPDDPTDGTFGQTVTDDPPPAPARPAAAAPATGSATAATGTSALGPLAATALVSIDRPADGASTPQRFTIMGWAVDPESTGSGVDTVRVYLDGEAGHGYLVGTAEYGGDRPDVADRLGQPRFGLSGYLLQVEVAPGEHTLYVYARRRGPEPQAWSAPTTVGIVAVADGTPTTAGRQPVSPTGCARAPDGTCLNRPTMASPTCPLIDPDNQCLPAAPGTVPGIVGQPNRPSVDTNPGASTCLQMDASNRCISYAANQTSFNLRAEGSGATTALTWGAVSGTVTYEVLRCNSASGQSCTSLAVLAATRFSTPRQSNSWYVVQARSGTGQVLASSNVVAVP
ncbi:MAG TPA: hypothetical protein VII06_41170 [Chloroflexota bacterium]|jgi:hypothetical protein